MKALKLGDAICMFPEGTSRYHPTIAPLKTGGRYNFAFDDLDLIACPKLRVLFPMF